LTSVDSAACCCKLPLPVKSANLQSVSVTTCALISRWLTRLFVIEFRDGRLDVRRICFSVRDRRTVASSAVRHVGLRRFHFASVVAATQCCKLPLPVQITNHYRVMAGSAIISGWCTPHIEMRALLEGVVVVACIFTSALGRRKS
jgi:hypothetical protein